MKKYKKPESHFVRNPGGLSGEEIARLSEEELSEYLRKDSFLQDKKKYRIKSGYILREIAGEYVIIPVDSGTEISNAVMTPNHTAAFLWKSFEQPSTIEDVVVKGMREYEVTEDTIRNSTEHFVMESLKRNILEEVD